MSVKRIYIRLCRFEVRWRPWVRLAAFSARPAASIARGQTKRLLEGVAILVISGQVYVLSGAKAFTGRCEKQLVLHFVII